MAHGLLGDTQRAGEHRLRYVVAVETADVLLGRKGDRPVEIGWLTGSIMSLVSLGRWDEAIAIWDDMPDPGEASDTLTARRVAVMPTATASSTIVVPTMIPAR